MLLIIDTPIEKIEGVAWRPLLEQASIKIVAALIIAVAGYWLAKWASRLVDRALTRANVEPLSRLFLKNLMYAVLLVLTATAVLQTLGVPATSIMAMLGAAGLGIGLALKDSLSNIASGVLLVVQRPFHVGDVVQIAGQEGRVTQVRMFVTYLRTLDNRVIAIPNSLVTSQPIINNSNQVNRRVEVKVGVGLTDDVDQARSLLLQITESVPGVLTTPAPDVIVSNVTTSNIELTVRAWCATADNLEVKSNLIAALQQGLKRNDMTLYPQRELKVTHSGADGQVIDGIVQSEASDMTNDGSTPTNPPSR